MVPVCGRLLCRRTAKTLAPECRGRAYRAVRTVRQGVVSLTTAPDYPPDPRPWLPSVGPSTSLGTQPLSSGGGVVLWATKLTVMTPRTLPLLFGLLAAAVVVFQACKTTTYTVDNLPDEQLRFGSGGGFAGTSSEHILLDNGQYFYKPQKSKQFDYVTAIDKQVARDYFKRVAALNLGQRSFKHPGNMYYYLQRGADEATRVTWGDINHPVDSTIQATYKALLATVNGVQRDMPTSKK